ncbi:MAG: MiaB/RimO family radical SAM methylthiotransferase [Candidatus Margulisiibacteriota bacterium]|nr:MiaB/RimO family radical SAM methylthiotransferase [Candidatus Margulisiibacteriota bacterium]
MLRYFIKTYGCQMNKSDSEIYASILSQAGYAQAKSEKDADLILVNTCAVRQTAEDRALWYLTSQKNRKAKIIFAGCIAALENFPKEDYPHVDLFMNPREFDRLALFLGLNRFEFSPLRTEKDVAWVAAIEGCNNFCSYCIVPYVRGRERSRPLPEIIEEIRKIDKNKYSEVVLLGQNINAYAEGLSKLLKEVSKIDGIEKIRFLTAHPRDFSDDIIYAVRDLPKVVPEFHLPIQHGDDEILEKMNRGYTVEYYLNLIAKIKKEVPEARFSTDLIVGFPGETEEQFQNSLSVIKKVKFYHVNMAAYSERTGTKAAEMKDMLPQEVRQERLQRIIAVVKG